MRLVKYLAHSGVASRRRAEEMIEAGRVSVGGRVVRDPARDVEFESGVEVDDGPTAPAKVRRVSARVIEMTIREGRNRQVRRMAEAIGNEVVELERTALGPLSLGDLAPGRARRLRAAELRRLWKDPRG